jgi:hypothetical protein
VSADVEHDPTGRLAVTVVHWERGAIRMGFSSRWVLEALAVRVWWRWLGPMERSAVFIVPMMSRYSGRENRSPSSPCIRATSPSRYSRR